MDHSWSGVSAEPCSCGYIPDDGMDREAYFWHMGVLATAATERHTKGIRALKNFPPVVCICGSTRFAERMNFVAIERTLAGEIVVRPEVVAYDQGADPQLVAPEVKARLDELHLRKIDLADYVYVVDVNGYIGDSTRRELEYAKQTGKPIFHDSLYDGSTT